MNKQYICFEGITGEKLLIGLNNFQDSFKLF